ncbi:hypothetical protein B0H13DRAFT_1991449 [Mycena leptocephala]|nr:hypothetical protein B0H13DRAFT_1991449 [Mycena leptocephala]
MVNQLLPYHLNNIYTMDVHYAYHLLERADAELSSMYALLSISSVATWWSIVLSVFTFASIFYHDTGTGGSSGDSIVPLNFWQMVTSRAIMVTIFFISTSCLVWMHLTLDKYKAAVQHSGSQVASARTSRVQ